jgi:4-phytase/acid phosphatase
MEYTDGLPLNQVAWGQLSLQGLSQQTRIITLLFDIENKPLYLDQLQFSNALSHILRTMEQAVADNGDGESFATLPGAFGNRESKLLVINSSDAYVAGVAGLLNAHWVLPGYQPDYCAPGGSLVFELRRSESGEDFVRVFYTAQTFDQLRNLTPLTLDQPPATMQLFVPGGSKSRADLDIDFETFEWLARKAIDEKFVQDPDSEVPPDVLTGVPLR